MDQTRRGPLPSGRRASVLSIVALMVLAGCGGAPKDPISMPGLTGERLDIALSNLERAGYDDDPEIVGGGVFGVIDESNWTVCEQEPADGDLIEVTPRLVVDRSCGSEDESEQHDAESTEDDAKDTEPAEDAEDSNEVSNRSGADPDEVLAHVLSGHGEDNPEDLCARVKSREEFSFWHSFWACWFDQVTDQPSYLQIELSTDGRTDAEVDELVESTARNWWGHISCGFEDLDTIVVRVNGLDHNTYRRDWPLATQPYCD